jgi:BirA family biotin operon repressor/biotin-[acetyl-CoA-carboxylase] ligase
MPVGHHPTIGRLERFDTVESTQDLVREWLADGEEELCIAVADEQRAGRGRLDRTWQAPPGSSLLFSIGFRPQALPLVHAWRVPAVVTLAMRAAALEVVGLAPAAIGLKWPNDLVGRESSDWQKMAGVLSEGLPGDGRMAELIVGVGLNVDWQRQSFPASLSEGMTSLRELGGGMAVDRELVLARFLELFVAGYTALSQGRFEEADWAASQITTGASVSVDIGGTVVSGTGLPPDPESGALRLEDAATGELRDLSVGEVVRCRVDEVETHL